MTRTSDVSSVADDMWRLTRVFERIRTQMMSELGSETEHTAMMLLFPLVRTGPMRTGALAEAVFSDASTVSRQVAVLVRDGLVERQADPADGRATILVPTPAARAVVDQKTAHRDAYLTDLFRDWKGADLHDLARLLDRMTELFETHKHELDLAASAVTAPVSR